MTDPTPNGQTWKCRADFQVYGSCNSPVGSLPGHNGCGPVPPAPSSDTPSDERCPVCGAPVHPQPPFRYAAPSSSPVPEASGRGGNVTDLLAKAAELLSSVPRDGERHRRWRQAANNIVDEIEATLVEPAPSSSPVGDRGLDVEQARPGTVPGSAADLNGHLASLIADDDVRVRVVLAVDAWLDRCDARAAADRGGPT